MAVADPAITPPVPPLISEAVSQNAYKLQTPQAFEQFVSTQPGGASLTPAQKQTLYGTVSKTRETHGLPAPPPPGVPQVAPGPISPAPPPAVPPAGGASPAATAPGGAPSPPLGNAAGPAAPPVDYNTPLKSPDPLVVPPPPAHETVPQFQGAEYHKPAKGLEYLALGIGLLFPGAPIGKAAASFAQGLNQGADSRYKRDEGAAEKQYEVKKAQADVDARGAQNDFNVALEQAKAKQAGSVADTNIFNQSVLAAQAQHTVDVKEGKFFKPPPFQTLLPKVSDPKTGKVSPDKSSAGMASAYNQMAQLARQQGASDLASGYDEQAKEFSRDAEREATSADSLRRTMLQIDQANRRMVYTQGREDARTGARIGAEYDLTRYREGMENARALKTDATRMADVRDKAIHANITFQQDWNKFTMPEYKYDATGQVMKNPDGTPIIKRVAPVGDAKALVPYFGMIGKASDPAIMAQHVADLYQKTAGDAANPSAVQLILQYGEAQNLQREARGLPILPHSEAYYSAWDKANSPKAPSSDSLLKAAGLNGADPKVKAAVQKATDAGLPMNAATIDAIKKDLNPPGGFHFNNPFTGGKVF